MELELENQITQLNYNWFAGEYGEEFQCLQVGVMYGNKKCDKILQHHSRGEGDRWFFEAHFSDGSIERIFNPNKVFYSA